MKTLSRLLLLGVLTGVGGYLLAELAPPLEVPLAANQPGVDENVVPETLAQEEAKPAPALDEAAPESPEQAAVHEPASEPYEAYSADGKEVLDAKDYKEVLPEPVGEGKEELPPVAEAPLAGPGSLGPGIGGLVGPPLFNPPAPPEPPGDNNPFTIP